MEKRYYLAYGSNLNIGQMKYRCPGSRIIGTAVLENYQLLFKGSKTGSYLTIEEKKGSSVPLAVWEVTPFDERRLDAYEGFPNFYYKKELELDIKGIKSGKIRHRKCFVYIMHEERPLGIPTRAYYWTCLEGYHDFKFDETILYQALLDSKEGIENEK